MQFRKNELDFLKVFAKLDDKKGSYPDMVKITFLPNQARFYSSFTFSDVIHTIDKPNNLTEEKAVIFPLNLMLNIIGSFSDDSLFTLTEEGIECEGEKYNFENHIVNMRDETQILNILQGTPESEATIADIKTLQTSKNYAGPIGSKLDTVALFNNFYVASTGYIASILHTAQSNGEGIYLPLNILSLLNENDVITLKKYVESSVISDFYYLDFFGIHIILPIQEYRLSNLSTQEIRDKFSYSDIVEMSKSDLYQKLGRILIIQNSDTQAKTDIHKRVRLIFDNKKLRIEILSNSNTFATTNLLSISDSLIGKEFIFSSQDLKDIMDGLAGEKVFLSLDASNMDETYFKLEDENHKSFFIHTPFS